MEDRPIKARVAFISGHIDLTQTTFRTFYLEALDAAIASLAEMKAFSDSQVNLRRLYTGYPDLGVLPGQAKMLKKHARRGSGGSLQLSMRRRLNRDFLETIHDEYSSDSESAIASPSLATRRGMDTMNISSRMNLSSLLDENGRLPRYDVIIRKNSLTHLPPVTPPLGTSSGLGNIMQTAVRSAEISLLLGWQGTRCRLCPCALLLGSGCHCRPR